MSLTTVIAPQSYKLENTIYLVFASNLVVFAMLLSMGFPSTLPTDINVPLVLLISSPISGLLIYVTPIKLILKAKLSQHAEMTNEKARELVLYALYIFRIYNLAHEVVEEPKSILEQAAEIVVDSDDLAREMWRIRGAIWFIFTLILTIPLVRALTGEVQFEKG